MGIAAGTAMAAAASSRVEALMPVEALSESDEGMRLRRVAMPVVAASADLVAAGSAVEAVSTVAVEAVSTAGAADAGKPVTF